MKDRLDKLAYTMPNGLLFIDMMCITKNTKSWADIGLIALTYHSKCTSNTVHVST